MLIRSSLIIVIWFGLFLTGTGQIVLEESDLPIVVIRTDNNQSIPDEPKVTAFMGIVDNGPGMVNLITGPYNEYEGKVGIEIRGSSSQLFPKKSYGLETREENGENRNVSLFGMPSENDWILHGPFSDKSLMRNALAYLLARKTGRYAPRTQFCELVINDEYKGIYLFLEKIKRDNDRVDIARMDPGITQGDEVTGGYILKLDKFTGAVGGYWQSPFSGADIQVDYPDDKDITSFQTAYIRGHVTQFEAALQSADYKDSTRGYRPFIEAGAWIDFILVNEITKNVDGYRLSTFFFKERDSDGGRMHAGPIWDFNLAFGNADYCQGGPPEGWALDFNTYCPNDFWTINFWWDRMLSDPWFGDQVEKRWAELRQGPFRTDSLFKYIDDYSNQLQASQARNFGQWPILNTYVWPNNFIGGTYEAEVAYLKNWVSQRVTWMDNNMERIAPPPVLPPIEVRLELYPNPSSGETFLEARMERDDTLEVYFYDLTGRRVSAFRGPVEAGTLHTFTFEGTDAFGNPLPAGIYPYRILFGDETVKAGKMVRFQSE